MDREGLAEWHHLSRDLGWMTVQPSEGRGLLGARTPGSREGLRHLQGQQGSQQGWDSEPEEGVSTMAEGGGGWVMACAPRREPGEGFEHRRDVM